MLLAMLALFSSTSAFAGFGLDPVSYCNEITNTRVCDSYSEMHCIILTEHNNFQSEALSLCSHLVQSSQANCEDDLACMSAIQNKTYSPDQIQNCSAVKDANALITCLSGTGK